MVKRLGITISDFVYDRELNNSNNISRDIEKYILLGSSLEDTNINNLSVNNKKLINNLKELKKELDNKNKEIKNLKLHIGRYKDLYNNPKKKAEKKYKNKQIEREVFNEMDKKEVVNKMVELTEKQQEHIIRQYQCRNRQDGTFLSEKEATELYNNRFGTTLTESQYTKLQNIAFKIIGNSDINNNFKDLPPKYVIHKELPSNNLKKIKVEEDEN
ncbi:MAG: hypothetical protein R6U15_01020 [Candidatus Izemoplasmatales bacterium]